MNINQIELKIQEKNQAIYDEVVKNNIYNVLDEEMTGKGVVDIGANIGSFCSIALKQKAKKIVAYEPNKKNFASLQEIFKDADDIILKNKAVYDGYGTVKISGEDVNARISDEGDDVGCVPLKDSIKYFEDNDELVLKIDCEGSEYKILFSADKKDLTRFKTIYIEIHTKASGIDFDFQSLVDYLTCLGYYQHSAIDFFYHDWDENGNAINYKVLAKIYKFKFQEAKIKHSVIIPTYNHFQDALKPCLESLLKHTDLIETELIIVANGCTDETEEYLSELEQKNITVVWAKNPLGYTKAINVGAKYAKGEYLILLNNDTVFLDFCKKNEWIKMLRTPFENDEKMAVTGPLYGGETYGGFGFLIFFCVMIKKTIFDELGTLDMIFNPGSGEDADLCIQAQKKGYKILQVPEGITHNKYMTGFPIYHKAEATVKDLKEWDDVFTKNTQILIDRYGERVEQK